MGKKITLSLLVLAATLLALPINAQLVVKKQARPQYAALKSGPVKPADLKKAKAARLKAESAIEGQSFTGQDFVNLMKACVDNAQNDKVALEKEMERRLSESLNGHKAQLAFGKQFGKVRINQSHNAMFAQAPLKAPRLGASSEVVDANGVITAIPEGDTKIYQREGIGWYASNGSVYYTDQAGTIEITELEDGTVYFKDFFSQVSVGSYIKGTKEGNTITVPAGQVVFFNTSEGYGLRTGFIGYNSTTGFSEVKSGDPYILTVEENTISLTETDFDFEAGSGTLAALFWTDDDSFSGYGDNSSVFTYDPEYVAPELVELPEGATVETWYQEQTLGGNTGDSDGYAKVAFVDNDVYLSGIFLNFPDAWIKGTIDGTTVTFSGLQFVGNYSGYDIFAVGTDGTGLVDFQMTYDAAAQTLTSVNGLLANAADDRIYYLEWYKDLALSKNPFPEVEATTGADVDVLPYKNALDSEASFGEFGVIDSNNDGKTWSFSASNGANYSYSSTNAANDWLISPAIKLEAGKKYHFAIDAKNNGYTEKFEVLLGAEAKASALTQSVIEEQVVNNAEFVTFENEAVEVAETGYYHFGIHAISDADQFRLMVANFLVEAGVEADAPDAVTDFALAQTEGKLEVTVSFKAPTKTFGGDDLTDNLTKIEILRNGALIGTLTDVAPGAEKSFVDDDATLTVGTYTYQVIPYNAVGIGVKSEEKSIFISIVLDVPQTFDFSQNLLDQFQVIDNNNDGKTWSWSASNGAYYPYSGMNDADDYLITLPFNLEAGKGYNVIVAAKNTGYEERFEVKVGKAATVEGLNETVIPNTLVESQEAFIDYEGTFTPAEDGQYYFAIHAISPADQFNLLISSLTIELAPEATAPAAIADFAVAAGAEGALEANLSFTAPAKAINGSDLSGTVDVNIYRDNELINTLTGIAVGSAQTWKDTNVEDGKTYTYYLVAANESGDGLKSEKASVYIGVDELGGVPDFAATSVTASNITFTWKPAEGVHGGYINTDAIVYTVYSMHIEEVEIIPGWTMQELVADDALETVTGATTATVDFNTLVGDQEYKYFGISASDGTDETDPADAYTYVLVGAPYELPIAESFVGNQLHYNWESNGGLGIDNASSDGDDVALKLYNDGTSAEVFFALPRVDLASAVNPTIIFDAKNGLNVDKVKVIGSADGAEYTVLGEFDITSDYTTIKQALSSVKGTAFSSVGILATIPTASLNQYEDYVVIDNIRIVDLYEYNLTADIQAPKSVVAGQKAKIVATVTNEGENAAEGYTVEIKANGKVLTTVVADKALDSFAKDVIEVDYETSVFDEAGDVTLTVNVDFEYELVPDDNTASTIITVKEPTAIAPASLLAEDKGIRGVDLTWAMTAAARAEAAAETTEDFEDASVFEPFSLGGITADEHNGAFGDWTLYDGNGIGTYGFQNIEFENAYQPMAFIVFDPNAISESVAETYAPHSGDQFLLSFCPVDENNNAPAADHWLISPELSGNAQTISFFARVITDQYGPETFEVWASSTDNGVASFTKVADYSTTATDWEEFTAELPAGSKFFAIRHTSTDVFGLLVDDVTFAAAGASAPVPTAFNIYYNGEKVGTAEADKTSYNVPFEKIAAGEQVFGVSAVYANGSESKAVTDTITIAPVEPLFADGSYYFFNKASQQYLAAGSSWGTHAVVNAAGLDYTITFVNGKYTLDSQVSNGGNSQFLNGEWNDGAAMGWIIEKTEDGDYTISNGADYLTAQDNGEVLLKGDATAEAAHWALKTKEDRIAELADANANAPVDATFLIAANNFSRNDLRNKAAWTGDDFGVGGDNTNMNAEKWGGNSQLFDIHQTIELPNGVYKVTWNGFYRYNNTNENTNAVAVAAHAEGTEVINSFVYLNDKDFALTSIADEAAVEALTALGKDIPFSQGDASFAFINGIYEQTAEIVVEGGQLTIGIKKIEHLGTDWTVWDNFRLSYLGAAVNPDDPEIAVPNGMINLIANGNIASDDVTSFVAKEAPSADIVGARIVPGAGKNNSRGLVVKSADEVDKEGAQDWDTQFWISLNQEVPVGAKLHVEFDYAANKAAKASTQTHAAPGNYIIWHGIGDVNFTTEWQHFSADVEVAGDMAGMQSVAFNLAMERTATEYYFDNFGVWYEAPIPVEEWTDLIVNGNMEGESMECFYVTEQGVGGPFVAVATEGIGKDGSKAVKVQSADDPAQDWDSQFFIRLPYQLPAGTKYKVSFDYKADKAGDFDTQAHTEPGSYIHWAMIGSGSFTTDWQTFSAEGAITAEQSKEGQIMQTIAFNLAKNKVATEFIFDNVKFEVPTDVVSSLTLNPAVDPQPYPYGIKSLMSDKNAEGVYNLNGQKVNVIKKGLYIQNGRKVVKK